MDTIAQTAHRTRVVVNIATSVDREMEIEAARLNLPKRELYEMAAIDFLKYGHTDTSREEETRS